jgi:phytoene dehydrogenase-like protein
VEGLYLCGSGTHPGGGVMGIPGLNASKVIISDHKSAERRRRLKDRLASYSRH